MTETINQAELRNHSKSVMDRLQQGTDFIVVRNGEPVGRLTPYHAEPSDNRPAATLAELLAMARRVPAGMSAAEVRAQLDAEWGEDRV
jgi:prevent-host-death family protein